jgi:ribosomal-protein-alanine N-acetyltransferase
MENLKSNRIYLREAQLTDTAFFIELMNTAGWLKYIGDRKIKTVEDACAYIENSLLASYKNNGFGLYVISLIETNTLIGMCGLVKRDTLGLPDLGFAILPQHEGKGYVFEACKRTTKFAKEQLELAEILEITSPTNLRSQNLLERLGFEVVQNNTYESDGETLLKYSLELK